MGITVNSSASLVDFTELATVKNELNINSTDDDELLADLILQASDFIRQETGRTFARETVTETVTGDGGALLVLERTPVQSIAFIEEDGSSVASTSYVLEDPDAGLVFRENGWTNGAITTHAITRRPTRHGSRNYEVKYTGGWNMPGSTGRDLPYDLERAAIDFVKTHYLRRQGDPGVTQEAIGEARISRNPGIPSSVESVLRKYRRVDL